MVKKLTSFEMDAMVILRYDRLVHNPEALARADYMMIGKLFKVSASKARQVILKRVDDLARARLPASAKDRPKRLKPKPSKFTQEHLEYFLDPETIKRSAK